MTHVLGKPEYASDWWIIGFLRSAIVLTAVQNAAYVILRAIERPHGEFLSQLSATAATVSLAVGAGLLAGLNGFAAALVVVRSVALITALWLLGREMSKREHSVSTIDG